jgi:hypothetical protein
MAGVDDPFAKVRQLARNYRSLSADYDDLLAKAQRAGHGTPLALAYIRQANQLAPEVTNALNQYHDAVADLVAFLKR